MAGPARALDRRLVGAVASVGALTILARALGLAKHLLIAWRFGTADACDAYLLALLLPTFLVAVCESACAAAMVPAFVAARRRSGVEALRRLVATFAIGVGAVLALVGLALVAGAAPLLGALGASFGAEKQALARVLLYALLPTLLFGGLGAVLAAALNAADRLAHAAAAPLISPLPAIAALLALPRLGILALAAGTVVGAAAQTLVLALAARRAGLLGWPRGRADSSSLRAVVTQLVPSLAGAVIGSTSGIVDQGMAARLPPGSLSALAYGNRLAALVVSVAALSLGTAVLPRFSQLVADGDFVAVRRTLTACVRATAVGAVAVTALLFWLSTPLVALFLQHGAFGAADTLLVSRVQRCYLLQIPFYLVGILGVRLLSALGQNRTLLYVSAVNVVLNFAGNWLFSSLYGLPGIALSTSVVYFCSMMLIFRALKRRLDACA